MSKEIPLTKGKVAIVDDEDFEYLTQWQWYYGGNYARRNVAAGKGKRKTVGMHQLLMQAPENMEVDHINRNKLDNRKCNLRLATHGQNQCNCPPKPNSASRYKGVRWDKTCKKWRADIMFDQRRIYLGVHNSEREAAIAYDKKAMEVFGEFAWLNFPKPKEDVT